MKRIFHAVKHETLVQVKYVPTAFLAVAGAILLITMVTWIFAPEPPMLWNQFFPVAFIVITLMTSGVFNDLREEPQRIEFLLRPTTAAEKVGAKLLVSSVGYWAGFVLIWIVAALIARSLYALVFSVPWSQAAGELVIEEFSSHVPADWAHKLPFAWVALEHRLPLRILYGFLSYLPVHAVFFFGSVFFKRKAFGRTLLVLVVWGLSYFLLATVLTRVIFAPYWANPELFNGLTEAQVFQIIPAFFKNPRIFALILHSGIALFFYALSWRRLMETEG